MTTPRHRRRFARFVIITLVVAWIGMLIVIGADLVELKRAGPPRLTPETDAPAPSTPAPAPAQDEAAALPDPR